ncbi:hypothetical protein Y032_0005g2707 [Ancylostoma ceylanicum]|nr:hypothetical protein Y032_0005g2707 [Ancylostoma ceylanicum]
MVCIVVNRNVVLSCFDFDGFGRVRSIFAVTTTQTSVIAEIATQPPRNSVARLLRGGHVAFRQSWPPRSSFATGLRSGCVAIADV